MDLLLLLLLVGVAGVLNKVFNQFDYQREGFDFDSLEVVEVIEQPDADCEHVTEKITVRRYDWMDEKGNIKSEKVAIGSTIEEKVVTIKDENNDDTEYCVKIKPRLNCHDQTDSAVLQHIRAQLVNHSTRFSINETSDDFTESIARMIDQVVFFEQRRDGYFIEIRGEELLSESPSLYFERELGWRGLIVEPVPWKHNKIATSRKSQALQSCVSQTTSPTTQNISNNRGTSNKTQELTIQCFPIFSMILGVGNPNIDILFLNNFKETYNVLRTIPWKKVDIDAIAVKTNSDKIDTESSNIIKYLKEQEYDQVNTLYDTLVFAKLKAGQVCPSFRGKEFLKRQSRHRCHIFSQDQENADSFCQNNFPLDFPAPSSPRLDLMFMMTKILRLGDKILILSSYFLSVVVNILYYSCHNCFLVITR